MSRFILQALCLAALCSVALASQTAGNGSQFDAMLKILPTHKERHVHIFKDPTGESPFRKGVTEERRVEQTTSETNSVAARIAAMITSDSVGGVMVGAGKNSSVVINNEVYGLNEEIRLSDGNGGTRPLVDGYQVIVRSVSKREIVLEGLVRGAASLAAPIRVNVPLDEFFH